LTVVVQIQVERPTIVVVVHLSGRHRSESTDFEEGSKVIQRYVVVVGACSSSKEGSQLSGCFHFHFHFRAPNWLAEWGKADRGTRWTLLHRLSHGITGWGAGDLKPSLKLCAEPVGCVGCYWENGRTLERSSKENLVSHSSLRLAWAKKGSTATPYCCNSAKAAPIRLFALSYLISQ
jgi:hypothetical protein